MSTVSSLGGDGFAQGTAMVVDRQDPLVSLALRYQSLIAHIESPDTDDDDIDRLMSEAMDIEAIMLRIEPVSIAGYVASMQFKKHFR